MSKQPNKLRRHKPVGTGAGGTHLGDGSRGGVILRRSGRLHRSDAGVEALISLEETIRVMGTHSSLKEGF